MTDASTNGEDLSYFSYLHSYLIIVECKVHNKAIIGPGGQLDTAVLITLYKTYIISKQT